MYKSGHCIIGSTEQRSKTHKKTNQIIHVLESCSVKDWSRRNSVAQQEESKRGYSWGSLGIPREWKHPDVKKPYMIVCSQSKRLWNGAKKKTS